MYIYIINKWTNLSSLECHTCLSSLSQSFQVEIEYVQANSNMPSRLTVPEILPEAKDQRINTINHQEIGKMQ